MESNNNFIHDLVEEHIAEGGKYYGKTVYTRFRLSLTVICI